MDTDVLIDIISHTPNPEIAIMKLCGIYKPKEITRIKAKNAAGETLTFASYDEWVDIVHCTLEYPEVKTAYFPKSVSKEDVTLGNFNSLKCPYSHGKEIHEISLSTGVMLTHKMQLSYDEWESLERVMTAREEAD